ncbi:MAG: UDP-N-acetylmuramoyl-L-alanine--D-glutamate ligase [Pseudohongiellaceae bacterium]
MNEKPTVIVGLGSTGISCVKYFANLGCKLKVVDTREAPPALNELKASFPNVEFELGPFNEATFVSASCLVVSPGVSLATPEIEEARKKGVPITGDIDIFAQSVSAPIVAVTGSNGKSTVVAILANILRSAGIDFGLGGNLDGENFRPALDLLHEPERELYVLELSSFQLETTRNLNAAVAVVLNISEDHMDRYASLEEYYQAKANIFVGCQQVLINLDDEYSKRCRGLYEPAWEYGCTQPNTGQIGLTDSTDEKFISIGEEELLPVSNLKVAGNHNLSNVLAAVGLSLAVKVDRSAIRAGVESFAGLPHRCQWVRQLAGVDYFNDSKATNVGAAIAAIEGLASSGSGEIVLIAGGDSKEADLEGLVPAVNRWCKQVILIGKDAEKFQTTLAGQAPISHARNLPEAVLLAQAKASRNDTVLFSPACASFDMFENFQVRGNTFICLVEELQ